MDAFHTADKTIRLIQIFSSAFLAILFLQSAIDNLVDRRGNLEWLTGHFSKSPLAGFVPLLLLVITLLELAAGLLSGIGAVELLLSRNSLPAFWGACLAVIALLCLFLGQRMAKDYPG